MITRLRARNFKSLRDLDLELGPLTVLVGPNMAGKSNVVEVLQFLFQCVFPPPDTEGVWGALALRGGMAEIIWKGAEENVVSFALEATSDIGPADMWLPDAIRLGRQPAPAASDLGSAETWLYEMEILLGVGGFDQIQKESLKCRRGGKEFELIAREGNQPWLVNKGGQRIGATAGSNRSALDRAAPIWDGYPFAKYVAGWRFYQLVPALMKAPNQVGAEKFLMKQGSNISAWLMGIQTRYPDHFNKVAHAAKDLLPGLQSLLTWPTQQNAVHLASHELGLKRPVNLWQMSDGELVLLALLSLIYCPPDLAGSLYCIEEPENHLYPKLLGTLLTLIRQSQAAPSPSALADPNLAGAAAPIQVILTTQSPYLVDQLSLDEVVWLEKREGATIAVRPRDREELKKLVADRDLGLGDIVYSGLLSEEG
jgi:predicted ATPase